MAMWLRFYCFVCLLVILPKVGIMAEMGMAENSKHFINVTHADGVYVIEPIQSIDSRSEEALAIAQRNTQRMVAIMAAAGEHCLIYFPAGIYPFDGAILGNQASIETSNAYQTIAGADMNATQILQYSHTVESTIRIRHDGGCVRDLYIGASDRDNQFRPDWEAQPLQTAIHLDGPISDWTRWPCDPRIQNVNINSHGNTILLHDYSRPFKIAVKITGSWLNVYIHTMWITDVFTAFDVDEGPVMAGPAKIIEVNYYSTHAKSQTKAWTTFFRSVGRFMEQVELIHCTFIGAQFIYMDGTLAKDQPVTPAYNMVIDHNYINVFDLGAIAPPDQAQYSGIYMKLPPLDRAEGSNYSRDIRITNNSCTGRAPKNGGFFYLEGMCRGVVFSNNDISCAGQDRCVYLKPTDGPVFDGVSALDQVAIRDVRICDNYFRTWSSPIVIGDDQGHPARYVKDDIQTNEAPDGLIASDAASSSTWFVQRVVISGNQSMYEGQSEQIGIAACYLANCEQVSLIGNTFADAARYGVIVNECREVSIMGNTLRAYKAPSSEGSLPQTRYAAISLLDCVLGTVTGNTLRGFDLGIDLAKGRTMSVTGNVILGGDCGIRATRIQGLALSANAMDEVKNKQKLRHVKRIQ